MFKINGVTTLVVVIDSRKGDRQQQVSCCHSIKRAHESFKDFLASEIDWKNHGLSYSKFQPKLRDKRYWRVRRDDAELLEIFVVPVD